jgi:hypothetical protein
MKALHAKMRGPCIGYAGPHKSYSQSFQSPVVDSIEARFWASSVQSKVFPPPAVRARAKIGAGFFEIVVVSSITYVVLVYQGHM